MSRRYEPDGTLLITALAGRIDVLEETTRQTATDVNAIGRGLGDLTGQMRRLTTSSAAGDGGDGQTVAGGRPGEDGDEPPSQWDWFAIDDPETARQLIAEVQRFATVILTHYGLVLAPTCWPVHPAVVADLLALLAERQTSYARPHPTQVSEWVTRWLPAGLDRIRQALAGCLAERGHRHAGRTYDLTTFDPHSVPVWWATDRDTDPVDAFALSPLT